MRNCKPQPLLTPTPCVCATVSPSPWTPLCLTPSAFAAPAAAVQVGISARPARSVCLSTSKASPLLAIRAASSQYGIHWRSPLGGKEPASLSLNIFLPAPSPMEGAAGAVSASSALLPTRSNPHR